MNSEATASRELPRYKSHKEVWALKIDHIASVDGKVMITPKEAGYAPFEVTKEYVIKHQPFAGGYWVRYKDGYESFSPAPQFEEGNTLIN